MTPPGDASKTYRLCAQLYVMNARGTVVAVAPVSFEVAGSAPVGSPVVLTASLPEDDATSAAVALAGRDGRWELVLCTSADCPQGAMTLEQGPAHSTVDTRQRTRVPSGCRGCGKPVEPKPASRPQPWNQNVTYRPGDIVSYGDRIFMATCELPAGCAPPPAQPSGGRPALPLWSPQVGYEKGAMVAYNGRTYTAQCAIPAGSGPPPTWPTTPSARTL